MPAEAMARSPQPAARAAFWAAALVCDLIVLVWLSRIPMLAAAVGVAIAAVFLVRRAEALLAFLFVGMPFLAPLQLRDGAALALLLGPRLLFLGAWALAVRHPSAVGVGRAIARVLADPGVLCTLGLALLLWIGLARSPAPIYGGGKARSFLLANVSLYAAPLLLWPRWRNAGGLDRFLRAAILIGALFAAVGVAAALGGGGVLGARIGAPSPSGGVPARLSWLGSDPIWTARLLAIWLVLLGWGATRRLVRPGIVVLLAAAGVYLMLRTGSRGPLVALLLSPVALLLLPGGARASGRGTFLRIARIAVPAIVLLGILLLVVLPDVERARLAAILLRAPLGETADAGDRLLQDPSVAFRVEMVRRSLTALTDGLPWGWGTGAFPATLFLRDFRLYPHNLEVEVLIELGLPGMLLLLGFLVFTLAHARRLARRSVTGRWLLLLAFMALLNAQVSGDITGNGELWFWAGMIGGLWIAARDSGLALGDPTRPAPVRILPASPSA
jgi:hypothetical protein